ncbi:MAG: M14 metallopeptidase family protein [Gemmatimonadota bacterium]
MTTRMLALVCTFVLGSVAVAQVPTPESVFGHKVGADFKLIDYDESIRYFQQLVATSDRIKLVEVGKTSSGRAWTLAIISSPQNLARLTELTRISLQLAHPAGLTDSAARRLAREGKAFVDISGGLHASEIAGSQHTIQLAYDLLAKNDEQTRRILDNDVLFLWPSINPDGQNIVVHWYREVVGTPYETAPLHELYQKYIGHDNNRDSYMLNVLESRVVNKVWRDWEPQIIYVQHQTAPFPTRIWLPPFAEPIANRAPPLMSREVNTIGMTIAQALETNGQLGATHMGTGFDAWYPGYIDYMPMLQNIAAYWTETALYQYATPRFYTLNDFPADMRDLRPQSLYASPWAGGWWRLRDAVDYMETASIATLDYAAKYKEDLLWNRYQAGRNTIAKYKAEPPYAYVIPQAQRDPNSAAELLKRMAMLGLRVSELSRATTIDGVSYPAGTWVIAMDQEFAELVRQLFEVQKYPDLREYPQGPPEQPYDAAGWTLPYQMDVRVVEARSPLDQDARGALRHLSGAAAIRAPSTSDNASALDPAHTEIFKTIAHALATGNQVRFQDGKYSVGAGAGQLVAKRIALFKPWTASMDVGWTEWLFDQYGLKHTTITPAEVRAGDLNARFDVIMFASDGQRGIIDGFASGTVPPRFEGGIGDVGVRALDEFARVGGTLVFMNQSANVAIDALHLPVKNVVAGLASKDYFASGSILEVTTANTHPVMAGMPERAKVFVDGSPVFTTLDGFQGHALAAYAASGSPLLSGYLLGEKHLNGYAAALDVLHGAGRVVLIGFRPQWRGQPMGTFRVVFNAALYGREVASKADPKPIWSAPKKP